MRAHFIVAVVAVLFTGLVAKQFLLPPKQAAAVVVPSASQNVLQLHLDTNAKALPVENMSDKTFIFTNEE